MSMMGKGQSDTSADPPNQFADRLNRLFATHLSPSGREYTLREVSDATGGALSVAYLSLLRKGGVTRPRVDKVQLLADFFGVSVTYFTDKDGTSAAAADDLSEALRAALAKPGVRELALRASELSAEEHALYLRLLDYAKEVAARVRAEQGAPNEGAFDTPADTGAGGDRETES